MVPTISIIDDDASVRTAIDNLLKSLGYAVLTFGSAEEFLQSDCLNATACIITDITMPGMSGIELLTLIRAGGAGVPLIFMTAIPKGEISRQVLSAGGACLLAKPFEKNSLVRSLERALGQSSDGRADE